MMTLPVTKVLSPAQVLAAREAAVPRVQSRLRFSLYLCALDGVEVCARNGIVHVPPDRRFEAREVKPRTCIHCATMNRYTSPSRVCESSHLAVYSASKFNEVTNFLILRQDWRFGIKREVH